MSGSWEPSRRDSWVALAGLVPLLTGHNDHRDAVTWLDVDDTMRETYGYAKQGVGYGYNKVKGLNALLGIVSTAVSAPIIVAHRLLNDTLTDDYRRWYPGFTHTARQDQAA